MPLSLVPCPAPPAVAPEDPLGLLTAAAEASAFDLPPAYMQHDLEEAIWGPDEEGGHPRWPAGTPGGLGGRFMHVGQTFLSDGHEWQVAHVFPNGKLAAYEASGDVAQSQTRIFDAAEMPGGTGELGGIKLGKPKVLKGGKGQNSNVPVVSPYVDHASHDPSIPIPPNSAITAAEWERFGKIEQLHYSDVMLRFGKHSSTKASGLVKQAYAAFDAEIQNIVNDAYSSQYGASSGYTLSLTKAFQHLHGMAEKEVLKMHLRRQKAVELQRNLGDIFSWDLYNRTRSPDLAAFHKNSEGSAYWSPWIGGHKKIFSGLSQSFHYRKTFFGSTALATPLSIRHVVMSTYSAGPLKGSKKSFVSEKEVSAPFQFKLDDRSVAFSKNDVPGGKLDWLEQTTEQPQGGAHLETFIAALKGKATLPIPPPAPKISMKSKGDVPPPPGAAPALAEYASKLPKITSNKYDPKHLPKSLPWAFTQPDGTPKAVEAIDSGFVAGDFMLGLKGTLYWVGPYPEDPNGFGLKYHKLVPDGHGGLEFNGESYAFEGGGKNKYFKLKGNVASLKPKGIEPFDPNAYTYSTGEAKAISTFPVGTKFKVNGSTYEITGKASASNAYSTPIHDLEQDLDGTINSDFQTLPLISKEGYVSANAKIAPKKGMTLALGGKKAVVTSINKAGVVSLKPSVAGSKVVKIDPDDAVLEGLFDPSAWKKGTKPLPIGNLSAGDYFSGSRGKTLHPHLVISNDGTWVQWQDLDTGKTGKSLTKKKVKPLVDATGEEQPEAEVVGPPATAGASGVLKQNSELKTADSVQLSQLIPGDTFVQDGKMFQLAEPPPAGGEDGKPLVSQISEGKVQPPAPFGTPLTEALFHQHADKNKAEGLFAEVKVLAKHEVGVDTLPEPPKWDPFKSSHGPHGAYKHYKLSEMQVGTVFRDKTGQVFKVQSTGATTIITDGTANYAVPGSHRGKVLDGVPWTKGSPPLPNGAAEEPFDPDIVNVDFSEDEDVAPSLLEDEEIDALPDEEPPGGDVMPKPTHELPDNWEDSQPLMKPNTQGLTAGELPTGSIYETSTTTSLVKKGYEGAMVMHPDGGVTPIANHLLKPSVVPVRIAIPPSRQHKLPEPTVSVIGNQAQGETFENVDGHPFETIAPSAAGFIVKDLHSGQLQTLPEDTPLAAVEPKAAPKSKMVVDLQKGDQFEGAGGHPFTVVAKAANDVTILKDNESGALQTVNGVMLPSQVQPEKPKTIQMGATPGKLLPKSTPADTYHGILVGLEAKYTPDKPWPQSALQGYGSKWGSGGKYAYDEIGDLEPGNVFRAKGQGKTEYLVLKRFPNGNTLVLNKKTNEPELVFLKIRVRKIA